MGSTHRFMKDPNWHPEPTPIRVRMEAGRIGQGHRGGSAKGRPKMMCLPLVGRRSCGEGKRKSKPFWERE